MKSALEVVSDEITDVINHGTADEAIDLLVDLRVVISRLDRALADPRHQWAK